MPTKSKKPASAGCVHHEAAVLDRTSVEEALRGISAVADILMTAGTADRSMELSGVALGLLCDSLRKFHTTIDSAVFGQEARR